MSDPTRLLEGGDPLSRRLLESAEADRPASSAARTTLVALGLTAPVAAAAAAPVVAAAHQGTLATVLGSVTAKVAIAITAAAVASATVVALAPKAPPRAAPHAPVTVKAPAPISAPNVAVSSLVAESTLLRGAADALAANDAARALAALDEHATRFPRGQLAEEAAALRVEALDASGDANAARAALEQFHARYPDSPFAPVIKAAPTGDVSPQADKETLK